MYNLLSARETKLVNAIDKLISELDKDKTNDQIAKGDYRLYDEEKFDPTGWLDALRSGNYKQGIGHLCVVNDAEIDQDTASVLSMDCSYCCLGVLLDITSNGWFDEDSSVLYEIEPQEDEFDINYRWMFNEMLHNAYDDGQGTLIGYEYADEMGLFEIAQTVLSSMNDAGATFEEIASVIEANDIRSIIDLANQIKGI